MFDGVFDQEVTQEKVFAEFEGKIQQACDGHKVSIVSYGLTGSGKT